MINHQTAKGFLMTSMKELRVITYTHTPLKNWVCFFEGGGMGLTPFTQPNVSEI